MGYLIYLVLDVLVTVGVMFIACKITSVVIEPKWLIITVASASFVSLIPGIGLLASIFVLFWLLNQHSNAKVWPDLVFMVIVSRLLSLFLVLPLLGA